MGVFFFSLSRPRVNFIWRMSVMLCHTKMWNLLIFFLCVFFALVVFLCSKNMRLLKAFIAHFTLRFVEFIKNFVWLCVEFFLGLFCTNIALKSIFTPQLNFYFKIKFKIIFFPFRTSSQTNFHVVSVTRQFKLNILKISYLLAKW